MSERIYKMTDRLKKPIKSGRHYGGFRCYYRSKSNRLVPDRSGGHHYDNGMFPSRDAAKRASLARASELSRLHPDQRWMSYEV